MVVVTVGAVGQDIQANGVEDDCPGDLCIVLCYRLLVVRAGQDVLRIRVLVAEEAQDAVYFVSRVGRATGASGAENAQGLLVNGLLLMLRFSWNQSRI